MLVVPNPSVSLQGISTDPNSGGPYVMWGGTDHAHVMVPIGRSRRVARPRADRGLLSHLQDFSAI